MTNLAASYPMPMAIAVVILGFVIAGILSWLTGRLLLWFDRRLWRFSSTASTVSPEMAKLLKRSVYAITIVMFGLAALRIVGLSELLNPAFEVLPGFLAGAAVILLGYLVATFVYQVLVATTGGQDRSTLIPRLAQMSVLVVSVLTGLTTMSIDVSFLGQSIIVLLLVTLGGLALAFALGSRDYVSNLLARRTFDEFAIGDRIRIDDLEGVILDFSTTSVLVRTKDGIAVIPARVIAESVVMRLTST